MRFILSTFPTSTAALTAAMLCLSPMVAIAQEPDCEQAIRALMTKTEVPVPVRYQATTEMSGQKMENSGITETAKRHLTMDGNGVPVSLFVDGKFYTSPDKGVSWKLQHTYSEEELAIQRDGVKWQADNASNFSCEFDIEIDGRSAHHYGVDFPLQNSETDITTHSEYWLDSETGFVFKALTISKTGGIEVTITQHIQPDPDAKVPVPED